MGSLSRNAERTSAAQLAVSRHDGSGTDGYPRLSAEFNSGKECACFLPDYCLGGGCATGGQKGCVTCHKDPKVLLSKNTGPMTLTAVAASMWNHLSMKSMQHPAIAPGEMRELVGYYWAAQFFQGSGVVARGKKVFAAKRCVGCHAGGGAGPVLSAKAGTWNGITMRHGPTMMSQIEKEHIPWPVFKAGAMDDLIAFMNSAPGK